MRTLKFITFYQNALHLTRVHCATFYQSALRHEQHEDVTPSSRHPFSCEFQWGRLVVGADLGGGGAGGAHPLPMR